MTVINILKNKKQKKDILIKEYNIKDSKKSLGLILLKGELVDNVLIDALRILPANFIIVTENKFEAVDNIVFSRQTIINSGFDFIVCDECEENLMKYLKGGVVPIIYKQHHIATLLSEFNAKRVDGNVFIFNNNALCDIYYAIIRFLENYKFTYDHKALVKNVLDV